MDLIETIKSALTSLRSNVMRTLLTMLGIIIGISSVILIYSLGQGAVAYVENELSTFGTNFFQVNPGSGAMTSMVGGANSITLDDVDAIREDTSLTNIQSVGAFVTTSTKASANEIDKIMLLYGMSPEIIEMLKPKMIYGDFYSADDNLNSERVIVIGKKSAETFFGTDTDPTGQKIKIDDKTFKVIGVAGTNSVLFGSYFDNALFIPLNTARHQISNISPIREVDIQVKNTDLMNDTISQVAQLLRDRHNLKEGEDNDFITASATDALSTIRTITNLLTLVIVAISAISLVVGGVGVMNIMLVAVSERTKEIGLLKAIGAQEKDILNQFLIEAVVMTGFGGILGIFLGIAGAGAVTLLFPIPLVISPVAIIIAVTVSMLVGIAFGLYPARHAARLNPIDALRYE